MINQCEINYANLHKIKTEKSEIARHDRSQRSTKNKRAISRSTTHTLKTISNRISRSSFARERRTQCYQPPFVSLAFFFFLEISFRRERFIIIIGRGCVIARRFNKFLLAARLELQQRFYLSPPFSATIYH